VHPRRKNGKIFRIQSLGNRNKALTTESRDNPKFQKTTNNKTATPIPGDDKLLSKVQHKIKQHEMTLGIKTKGKKEIQWNKKNKKQPSNIAGKV